MSTPRKLKARRMWMDYDPDASYNNRYAIYATKAEQRSNRPDLKPIPVAVIPLDDVDALVETAFNTFGRHKDACRYDCREAMRAALTAIGVLPKQRKGRK